MQKPIGILGGTFDPVHFAHLRMAFEVQQRCDLQEVRMIPLYTPAHRQMPAASTDHRLRMLKLAVSQCDKLMVDERELQRQEVSYTVDTLRSMREELGGVPLCLIMGMDAFQSLNSWRSWEQLLDYAHIVVARRANIDIEIKQAEVRKLYNDNVISDVSDLHSSSSGKILMLDTIELEISSTTIRELIAMGQSPQFLLPDTVLSHITKEGLYDRH